MNNYPHEISLGQKQLIAFIRTILIDSQYLLLDEPTSALNIENINKVKNIILELKKLNKTVLIISHDKYFSESISDKNYYISD
jgi:polar amino acid transport system ATP-binding protein